MNSTTIKIRKTNNTMKKCRRPPPKSAMNKKAKQHTKKFDNYFDRNFDHNSKGNSENIYETSTLDIDKQTDSEPINKSKQTA